MVGQQGFKDDQALLANNRCPPPFTLAPPFIEDFIPRKSLFPGLQFSPAETWIMPPVPIPITNEMFMWKRSDWVAQGCIYQQLKAEKWSTSLEESEIN